ncbi:MAG: B12-binding domain-containing radical SAM protein [Deferrisomatales bacterium]
MKILLVSPEFPDTFWSFRHALKFIRKDVAFPPLGLLTVAAMLPHSWEKRLVDLNLGGLQEDELHWADLVMLSAMTVQRDSAQQVIDRCRMAGVPVVAGGPLFTTEPERFPQVDHLVLNEAELTLPGFLNDWANGRAQRVYSSSGFADLRETPVPLWELAELKRYGSMPIQYSRGCPYHCDFCSVTALLGHRPRLKAAHQVLAELEALYAQGWRSSVFFVDDNFIGNTRNLKTELLPALIDWQKTRRKLPFFTEASVNLADDPDLVEMMVAAGFHQVFIGIETPHEASLEEISKQQNRNRDLLDDVKRLQRAGLEVQAGFIVGFDSDPPSIFQRQIEFIKHSGIVTAMVGLLQAPPGTRLHERLGREGRLVGDSGGNNVSATTNFVPAMGLARLQEGYAEILCSIYAPQQFYARLRTFLREYRLPAYRVGLDFQQRMAFFRSVYHLGIRGRERFHYWGTLFWTICTRPRLVPLAITLAIYGYHFRKVCEQLEPSGAPSPEAGAGSFLP